MTNKGTVEVAGSKWKKGASTKQIVEDGLDNGSFKSACLHMKKKRGQIMLIPPTHLWRP